MPPCRRLLTVFGHLGDDVGYFRGARRLWVEQRKKIMEDVHLLDLHAGLGVYERETPRAV